MRSKRLVAADFVGAISVGGQGVFEARDVAVFDKDRGLSRRDGRQVDFVEPPVVAMCLPAEDWQQCRLRAAEHGDGPRAADVDDLGRNGIDAQCRKNAGEDGQPENAGCRQGVHQGARLPPRPGQINGGKDQPVPAAEGKPEGESGQAAAQTERQQHAEPEWPADADLRQGDGKKDGERQQRADQVAVKAFDQQKRQEGGEKPE